LTTEWAPRGRRGTIRQRVCELFEPWKRAKNTSGAQIARFQGSKRLIVAFVTETQIGTILQVEAENYMENRVYAVERQEFRTYKNHND
jgi:hypothetical protein